MPGNCKSCSFLTPVHPTLDLERGALWRGGGRLVRPGGHRSVCEGERGVAGGGEEGEAVQGAGLCIRFLEKKEFEWKTEWTQRKKFDGSSEKWREKA